MRYFESEVDMRNRVCHKMLSNPNAATRAELVCIGEDCIACTTKQIRDVKGHLKMVWYCALLKEQR